MEANLRRGREEVLEATRLRDPDNQLIELAIPGLWKTD